MMFSTRKEAEAHDKMLAIAERLAALLQAAELNLTEDTLETLTWFMAQHREEFGTLLKGGQLPPPKGNAPPAVLPQDRQDVSSSVAPKSSKAAPSASATKPKTAA